MKRMDVAIGVVVRDGRILICLRREGAQLGGYWEFPGGKREVGETLEDCVARELREEVGMVVTPTLRLTAIEHDYPYLRVTLHPFLCQHVSGEAQALESQQCLWIEPKNLREFRFPPANDPLLQEILDRFSPAQ